VGEGNWLTSGSVMQRASLPAAIPDISPYISASYAATQQRRTPNQLHTLPQNPTQHDRLPKHLVYKKELIVNM